MSTHPSALPGRIRIDCVPKYLGNFERCAATLCSDIQAFLSVSLVKMAGDGKRKTGKQQAEPQADLSLEAEVEIEQSPPAKNKNRGRAKTAAIQLQQSPSAASTAGDASVGENDQDRITDPANVGKVNAALLTEVH